MTDPLTLNDDDHRHATSRVIGTSGFYSARSIPMTAYLADPAPKPSLSSGCAHTLISRSPLHAYTAHPKLGNAPDQAEAAADEADSDAATVGTIAHELLFGGDGKLCVIEPSEYRSEPKRKGEEGSIPKGWTNNAIRAARDLALSNGLTPVLPKQMAGAKLMSAAARRFLDESELAGVLDGDESECWGEVTMLLEDEGTWFRARPDWMNNRMRVMLHYKSTKASAHPESFSRGVLDSMGYDVSLAFYRWVFEKLTGLGGDNDWRHVILVQEQQAPFACSLITLDPAKWQIADEKVIRARLLWDKCLRTGKWPAYPSGVFFASPTAWMLAEAEMRLSESR